VAMEASDVRFAAPELDAGGSKTGNGASPPSVTPFEGGWWPSLRRLRTSLQTRRVVKAWLTLDVKREPISWKL
jgi:hypothetical protein